MSIRFLAPLLTLLPAVALAGDPAVPAWPDRAALVASTNELLYDAPATTEEELLRRWGRYGVHLTWPAATGAVASYRVLQGDKVVATLAADEPRRLQREATGRVAYAVLACDAGNRCTPPLRTEARPVHPGPGSLGDRPGTEGPGKSEERPRSGLSLGGLGGLGGLGSRGRDERPTQAGPPVWRAELRAPAQRKGPLGQVEVDEALDRALLLLPACTELQAAPEQTRAIAARVEIAVAASGHEITVGAAPGGTGWSARVASCLQDTLRQRPLRAASAPTRIEAEVRLTR